MAVVAADLHQSSRGLGCCSCHAWQAENWVVDRYRSVRYRHYRYHRCYRYRRREESWALAVPPLALAHLAGLAEAADRFRQG